MSSVYIASPLYDQRLDSGTARSLHGTATKVHRVYIAPLTSSLLANNCNVHWCTALNHRSSHNLQWFAMLHADVVPEAWWLDTLIAEAEKHSADMVSAVIRIKGFDGATSTAIAMPGDKFRYFCRLTLSQVNHPDFPATFDIHSAADALERLPDPLRMADVPREALYLNTGCFVCRLDRPWCERVWFSNEDQIELMDGLWKALFISEDWMFSKRIAEQGGKVMATKTVAVNHRGLVDYHSKGVWGQPQDRG